MLDFRENNINSNGETRFITNLILGMNSKLSEENATSYKDFYEVLVSNLSDINSIEIITILKIFYHNIKYFLDCDSIYTDEYIDNTKRLFFEYYKSNDEDKIELLQYLKGLNKKELEIYRTAQQLGLQNKLTSNNSVRK